MMGAKSSKQGPKGSFLRVAAALAAILMLAGCGPASTTTGTKGSTTTASAHTHRAKNAASCEEASVCAECGAVMAPALGHDAAAADCENASVCRRCGKELSPALGHDASEAKCDAPSVCLRCGKELSPALGHDYKAQADGSRVCSRCGDTIGAVTQNGTSEKYIPETESGGHYNQTLTPYYGGAVLVCGDYGLEYFQSPASGAKSYADAVNAFREKYPGLNVSCMLIPKLCAFEVPEGYKLQEDNQRAFITATYAMIDGSVKKPDAIGAIAAHRGEYMYYRTDHHWTSLGAYYAFTAYCRELGLTAPSLSAYKTHINGGFTGSLYYYAGNAQALKQNLDYTVVREPLSEYTLSYTSSGSTREGRAVNPTAVGYAGAFLNGDQALTSIKTANKNGRKLMVFKDSFGNALSVYLIDCFEEVYVVDVRMDTQSVEKLIEQLGITDVLIVNNVQAAEDLVPSIRSKIMS